MGVRKLLDKILWIMIRKFDEVLVQISNESKRNEILLNDVAKRY